MEVAHEFRLGYHRRAGLQPPPGVTTDSDDEDVEDGSAPEPVIPKGLKWGRDEWLLTAADDHVMRIFDRSLSLKYAYKCGEALLDFCWDTRSWDSQASSTTSEVDLPSECSLPSASLLPTTTTTDAGPDRFFVSCKGRPIHLVGRVDEQDRCQGSFGDCCSPRDDVEELGIIATYPGINHVEEVTHAFSLCASSAHVFGGYESAVRVFDLARPGHRSVLEIVTNTRKRNYGKNSPHGILGALSLREESGVLAVGSYSGQIGLYDPFRTAAAFFCQTEESSCGGGSFGRRNDSQHGLAGKGARAEGREKKRQKATCKYALGVCSNMQPGFDEVVDPCRSASSAASRMGGITQLEWVDSFHLLSGHRKDDYLRLWDIRMLGGPDQQASVGGAKGPLVFSLPRSSRRTAQRLSFCVSGPCCLSGDDAGFVHWYRLDTGERARSERLVGCDDVVVSCDWSLESPLIATCQGSRKFADFDQAEEERKKLASAAGCAFLPPAKRPRLAARAAAEAAGGEQATGGERPPQPARVAYEKPEHSFRLWRIAESGGGGETAESVGDCGVKAAGPRADGEVVEVDTRRKSTDEAGLASGESAGAPEVELDASHCSKETAPSRGSSMDNVQVERPPASATTGTLTTDETPVLVPTCAPRPDDVDAGSLQELVINTDKS